jgi:hypothetical protein
MKKILKTLDLRTSPKAPEGIVFEAVESGSIGTDALPWEKQAFLTAVSADLNEDQVREITEPAIIFPIQQEVLAVHWHPEHIPFSMLEKRINRLYPDAVNTLIIPTQHNSLMEYRGYAGLEIDCYSPEFDRKVQLLLHFTAAKAAVADRIRVLAEHTFRYRAKQLFEILHTLTGPADDEKLLNAAAQTEAETPVIEFVRAYCIKLIKLISNYESLIKPDFFKNKLIRDFFDELRGVYDSHVINLAQIFIKAVKENVKAVFSPKYFYKTQDVISEARACGGCVVVPHPEQFWPILLADYDVDGYEVWNPQSRQYTEFLIGVVAKQNKYRRNSSRPYLVFMGDDTHFGEKVKKEGFRDAAKASREIGVQPAWEDLDVRNILKVSGISRLQTINDYRQRLGQA